MSPRSTRRKPVLIIQHAEHEHPAAIRRALETQALPSLWIHPYQGERYPDLAEISGVISLGGPMNANEEAINPWIPDEISLLRRSVETGLPTVGVCLGGQLMARALGGRVEKHSTTELGWWPVRLNEAGRADPIAGAAGPNPILYHWHADTFHLPPGAELLGMSDNCERQAFRIGQHAYGFQFHPEADHQLVIEWLSDEAVAKEIDEAKALNGALDKPLPGNSSVQDVATQRAYAMTGEMGSLKITAAIGSLFNKREFFPVNPAFRRNLEQYTTDQTLLTLDFMGSSKKIVQLRGQIASVLWVPAGEFVIFQEENTLLWPIRLDDIRKIKPAK